MSGTTTRRTRAALVLVVATLLVPTAGVEVVAQTPPDRQWREVGNLNYQRIDHRAVRLDGPACRSADPPSYCGKVVVTGGYPPQTGQTDFTVKTELFDPATLFDPEIRAWTEVAQANHTRHRPYRPRTLTLLDGPECRGPLLEYPRHCGTVLAGGNPSSDGTAGPEVYDPSIGDSGQWSVIDAMSPGEHNGFTYTVLDGPQCRVDPPPNDNYPCGNVLAAGGLVDQWTIGKRDPEPQLYDPVVKENADGSLERGSWKPVPPMNLARSYHTAVLLDGPACRGDNPAGYCGKVLVAGGGVSGWGPLSAISSAEIYDPESGTTGEWTSTDSMAVARGNPAGILLDGPECHRSVLPPQTLPSHCGKVLVTDGQTSEIYDPGAGKWTELQQVPDDGKAELLGVADIVLLGGPECGPAVPANRTVPAHCGSVLLVRDGRGNNVMYRDGRWTRQTAAEAQMNCPRGPVTVTSLASGEVLVAGGRGAFECDNTGDKMAEVFDPVPGSPKVHAASPSPIERGDGTSSSEVTLTGKNLEAGASVYFSGAGIAPSKLASVSTDGRTGKVHVTVAADAAAGARDVVVLTDDGEGGACARCLRIGAGSVELGSVVPSSLPRNSRHETVTIKGANFAHDAQASFGDGVVVHSTSVPNPTVAIADISVPREADLGPRNVTVGSPAGENGSCSSCFTVLPEPAPAATAVVPPVGTGGMVVSLIGTGFTRGDASVSFGSAPAHVAQLVSDTEIRVVVPPQPSGTTADLNVTIAGVRNDVPGPRFTYGHGRWERGVERLCPASETPDPLLSPLSPQRSDQSPRPCPPARHTATVLRNGDVLFLGGESIDRANVWEKWQNAAIYRPGAPQADRWQEAPPMRGGGRVEHSATLLSDGRVLVAGGRTEHVVDDTVIQEEESASAEIFDPDKKVWLATATPMGTARAGHTATLLDGPECRRPSPPAHCGKVLIAGGFGREIARHVPLAGAEIYDPRTGSFTPTGALSEGRATHTATLLANGEVLVAGGLGPSTAPGEPTRQPATAITSAEVYNPVKGTWRRTGAMAQGRFWHTATLVDTEPCGKRCGMVLAVGGIDSGGKPIAAAELYDHSRGTWTATSTFQNSPRAGHTATPLDDGTILVAGARGGSSFGDINGIAAGSSLSEAEIYDPVADVWAPTNFLHDERGFHSASRLGGDECRSGQRPSYCGKVLVVAGEYEEAGDHTTYRSVVTTELYTPAPVVRSVSVPGSHRAVGPTRGGTDVVINGVYLSDADGASFGGTPATKITAVSPSEIAATTPAHDKGPAEVSVAHDGLVSAPVSSASFAYAGGTAKVLDLAAEAVSPTDVELTFTAPDDGTTLAPATRYVVKQSTSGPLDDAGFDAATALCGGVCTVPPGQRVRISVSDLEPATTYHYALKALNAVGEPGVVSVPAAATTRGDASACPALPVPASGQLAYPGGAYSLVGLPGGTVVGADVLYGWFDQGAGGHYTTHDGAEPLARGHAYWAWFTCPRLVDLDAGVESVRVPLGGYRASMVGNPSATSPALVSGHDFAARWDTTANAGSGGYRISGYRQAQEVPVGQGLWLFSYVPTEVHIEAAG